MGILEVRERVEDSFHFLDLPVDMTGNVAFGAYWTAKMDKTIIFDGKNAYT